MLANAMLLTLRGVPTIYSGDEQGFVGKGGDQDSRQDMFASRVASYNEDRLLGTQSTTAQANFNADHPSTSRSRSWRGSAPATLP
jgi:glycosidase